MVDSCVVAFSVDAVGSVVGSGDPVDLVEGSGESV